MEGGGGLTSEAAAKPRAWLDRGRVAPRSLSCSPEMLPHGDQKYGVSADQIALETKSARGVEGQPSRGALTTRAELRNHSRRTGPAPEIAALAYLELVSRPHRSARHPPWSRRRSRRKSWLSERRCSRRHIRPEPRMRPRRKPAKLREGPVPFFSCSPNASRTHRPGPLPRSAQDVRRRPAPFLCGCALGPSRPAISIDL